MITTSQSKMKKGRSDACSLVALGFCRIDLDTIHIISVAVRHDFKDTKFQGYFWFPKFEKAKLSQKFPLSKLFVDRNSLLRRIL